MDLITGLGCLAVYVISRLIKGKETHVDSSAARNFGKIRNSHTGGISGLKEVKAIKRRCFK